MSGVISQAQTLPGSRSTRIPSGTGGGGESGSAAPAAVRRRLKAPPTDRGPVHLRHQQKPALFRLAKIHWLTASFTCDPEHLVGAGAEDEWTGPIHRGARFMGDWSYEHQTGARVYFTPGRTGCFLLVSGDACDLKSDWLPVVTALRGRITRIDLAVDLGPASDARAKMLAMHQAWFAGEVQTDIRTFEEHRSYGEGDGFTWYFGGQQAELRLCAYDRRGPLRLEFRWHPDDRHRLLAEVIEKDWDRCWRLLASRIVFPFDWYARLLRGEMLEPPPVEVEPTEYQRVAFSHSEQWAETCWALSMLGVSPDMIARRPTGRIRSSTKAKWRKWAFEAGPERGSRLLAELESL